MPVPVPEDPEATSPPLRPDGPHPGSDAARDELVRHNLRLAHHLALRFGNRGIPLDDLVQVASLGLVNAAARYDPSRGTTFATFATPTIVGEIKRHFRDRSWDLRVPRRIKELYLDVNTAISELNQRLGRSPTIAEIALATRAAEEEVLEAMEAGHAFQTESLEGGDRDVDTDPAEPDVLARPDEDLHGAEDRVLVDELLAELPARELLIVRLHFFENMTQHEIATRLGISQVHVSRLLRRTLDFLREHPRLHAELQHHEAGEPTSWT